MRNYTIVYRLVDITIESFCVLVSSVFQLHVSSIETFGLLISKVLVVPHFPEDDFQNDLNENHRVFIQRCDFEILVHVVIFLVYTLRGIVFTRVSMVLFNFFDGLNSRFGESQSKVYFD